jgi:lactobin A/cerein 7B family class IIb bacteriocin
MASIIVDNLPNCNVCGSDLFNDSESFLQELTEDELLETNGGITPTVIFTAGFVAGVGLGIAISYYTRH